MLCNVIEDMSISILLFLLFSILLNILSHIKRNSPPVKNPVKITIHGVIFNSLLVSMAGAINEKNDAAIITPAANPNIPSIIFLFMFLKKNMTDDPNTVSKKVNNVAIKA